MKIPISKEKFFLYVIFLILITGIVVSRLFGTIDHFTNSDYESPRLIIQFLASLFLIVFMIFMTMHLLHMWKFRKGVIELQNGKLKDLTSLLNRKRVVSVDNIRYVSIEPRYMFTNQICLVMKHYDSKKMGFINQLNGRSVYITDFMISKADLMKLKETLEQEMIQ